LNSLTCAHRIGATAIEPGFLHWAGRNHSSWWQRCTDLEIGTTACFFVQNMLGCTGQPFSIWNVPGIGSQFGRSWLPNWMAQLLSWPAGHNSRYWLQCQIWYERNCGAPATVLHYVRFIGRVWPASLFRTVLRPWVVVSGPPTSNSASGLLQAARAILRGLFRVVESGPPYHVRLIAGSGYQTNPATVTYPIGLAAGSPNLSL